MVDPASFVLILQTLNSAKNYVCVCVYIYPGQNRTRSLSDLVLFCPGEEGSSSAAFSEVSSMSFFVLCNSDFGLYK